MMMKERSTIKWHPGYQCCFLSGVVSTWKCWHVDTQMSVSPKCSYSYFCCVLQQEESYIRGNHGCLKREARGKRFFYVSKVDTYCRIKWAENRICELVNSWASFMYIICSLQSNSWITLSVLLSWNIFVWTSWS